MVIYTIKEASELLGLSIRTMGRRVSSTVDEFPGTVRNTDGKVVGYEQTAFDAFIACLDEMAHVDRRRVIGGR